MVIAAQLGSRAAICGGESERGERLGEPTRVPKLHTRKAYG